MKVFHWIMQIKHGGLGDVAMSMGYGGSAKILMQDETTVVYEYLPYNLNNPEQKNSECIWDGLITISKSALVEPKIHKKMKRMPSGKKQIVEKRIKREVNYDSLLSNGEICIENSRYCWHFIGAGTNVGMIAMRITCRIFERYQDEGRLPEKVSVHY